MQDRLAEIWTRNYLAICNCNDA